MTSPLILAVDDDPHITEVIEFSLLSGGFKVLTAANAENALTLCRQHSPDLIILDINLPDKDGLWVCQKVREFSQTPILFLSARDEEVDRVMGLTIGGDDYVTKPFSPRELVARVRAILKRSPAATEAASAAQSSAPDKKCQNGLLRLDLESFTAYWDDKPADLTVTEFQILKTIMARPAKVFTRDDLLDQVYQNTIVSDRTIDSHILHIRKKFAALGAIDLIQTQRGIGYKLGCCR